MATLPLTPFHPTRSDPWDRRKAAHLLRRAGFGAPRAEVEQAFKAGPAATLQRLMPSSSLAQASSAQGAREMDALLDSLRGTLLDLNDRGQLQAWWLFRMLRTGEPVREKLTLFWHGHFVSADDKVDNRAHLLGQNQMLRQKALGPFRDLATAVCRDPAMLLYLDGAANTKKHPNENFAREWMELFTLGKGHYSEPDVREAARAFTGWNLTEKGEFNFDRAAHDDGVKTFLGKTGALGGNEVIETVLAQPACSDFLARKLARFFLADEPTLEQVEPLSATLRATGMHVGETVRALLGSHLFYSAAAFRARVKSPCELGIGMLRELGVRANLRELADTVARMGQELFNPPNVKGWDGGRVWITTDTLRERMNLAAKLAYTSQDNLGFGYRIDTLVPGRSLTDTEGVVRELLGVFGMEDARPETIRTILDHARQPVTLPNNEVDEEAARDLRYRGVIHLILTAPEYQLC